MIAQGCRLTTGAHLEFQKTSARSWEPGEENPHNPSHCSHKCQQILVSNDWYKIN